MYYIYHIPGIKIGCSMYPKQRVKAQGYSDYEILETHEDGWLAGDREIELQKQYGYSLDNVHYMISVQNRPEWDNSNKVYTSEHARYANSCRTNTKRSEETKLKISRAKQKLTTSQKEFIKKQWQHWNGSKFQFCTNIGSEFNVSRSTIDRII